MTLLIIEGTSYGYKLFWNSGQAPPTFALVDNTNRPTAGEQVKLCYDETWPTQGWVGCLGWRFMKYFSFKRFKDEILLASTPPIKTATSLALGVALAFSPFLGLHIVLAFTCIRIFRLNGVVLLAGLLIHNPWSMIPIHMLGVMIGDLMLSGGFESMEQFQNFPWKELGLTTLFSKEFWMENSPTLAVLLKPFLIGHLLMSTVCGIVSYKLARRLLQKKQAKHDKSSHESMGEKPFKVPE